MESYEVPGEQRDTSLQKKGGDNKSTEDGIGSSMFAVLVELSEEEDIGERISTLKQKIQAIPSQSGTGGKAHPLPGGKNKRSKESGLAKGTGLANPKATTGTQAQHRPDPLKEVDNNKLGRKE